MIKVLNVTSDHNIGGAGRCILTFLAAYDRSQFEVVVVLPRGSALIPYIEQTKTRYVEVDGMQDQSYSEQGVKALMEVFRQEKPNVVHAHASFSARIAAKTLWIPVVYTRHSVFPNSPKVTKGIGKLINGMANNFTAKKIIAVAEAAKKNLTEAGVSAKKIVVIKNGVRPIQRYSREEWIQARQFFGLKEEDFVFAMVARLEDIKGHDYFLEAARNLSKRYPHAKFMICGTGAYESHLKDKVKEYGLKDSVLMTGYINDVTSVMNTLDVNVNASYGTEATSLSLLEGMSIGKPIIASDYGGNPELVEDGKNGLLFPVKNAQALEACMERMLTNQALVEKLSQGAYDLYQKNYTAEIMTNQIQNVYLQIAKGRK